MKGREQHLPDSCLQNHWSRKISRKVDGIGAFSQHCGFHQLYKQVSLTLMSCFPLALLANTLLSLPLQLMKATMLAESSYSIYFHRDLSAPAMSKDVNQVGVALFPSFSNIFSLFVTLSYLNIGWLFLPLLIDKGRLPNIHFFKAM